MERYKHTNLSDEELLRMYRSSRDNKWLGYLLQRYTLLLLGVAMKYLKDKDEAQDAVQQVFLKAITHFPKDKIENFKGWLYILMRNHCLQLLRDKTYKINNEALSILPVEETNKEDIMQKDYTLEQLNDAVQELSKEQKETISLFYFNKMSYQQIMERTGFTFTQVKSHIQNGKRNLKQILYRKLGKNINE